MNKRGFKKISKTAYHEAGHAVAAFVMGKRFKNVSIIPDPADDSLGRLSGCHWRSKLNPEFDEGNQLRQKVEAQIIILLAGCVAEAKLTGRYNHIGASKDYHDAIFFASYVTGSTKETEAYIKWLLEKTKNILSHYRWDGVELLANELIKRRKIGYMTARKIIKIGFDKSLPTLAGSDGQVLCPALGKASNRTGMDIVTRNGHNPEDM